MKSEDKFVSVVKTLNEHRGVTIAVLVDDSFSQKEIDEHIKRGMGAAEIRIDLFQNDDLAHIHDQIKKFSAVPTLATIRKITDGGKWDKTEEERISIFESIIPEVDAIDVELAEPKTLEMLMPLSLQYGCELVASYHNFEKTPSSDGLQELITNAKRVGVSAVKIACKVNNVEDNARLAALFDQESGIELIIIGMGELGMPSRISFPALGSLLTYSPSDKIPASYGQISFSNMVQILSVIYPAFCCTNNIR